MIQNRLPWGAAALLALLALVSLASGKDEKRTFPFSQQLDFKVGEEIPLDGTIGRLQISSALVETDRWYEDDYQIRLKVSIHNPKGSDLSVHIRATFNDAGGKALATAEDDDFEIEEDEVKTFKVTAHVTRDPATIVANFLLEIDAWGD